MSTQLEQLQSVARERDALRQQLEHVRQAHMAQQAFVLELQDTAQKSAQLKIVVKTQEQVIQQLEKLLKTTLTSSADSAKISRMVESVLRSSDRADESIMERLASQNKKLHDRVAKFEATEALDKASDRGVLEQRIAALEAELLRERQRSGAYGIVTRSGSR
nr:hypothetical protein HK105_006969 [Polyrhizophydium stewartii]